MYSEELKVKALSGDQEARFIIGTAYLLGQGVEPDPQEAVKWFASLAREGYPPAMRELGDCLCEGLGAEADPHRGALLLQKAAEAGDAEAFALLGYCYYYGKGVTSDETKVAELFTQGAYAGSGHAMVGLGRCYFYGVGVGKNEFQAAQWWQKAAELGNGSAMYELSLIFDEGTGVEKDPEKSLEWLHKAAELNESRAQCDLGVIYLKGEGVEADDAKAYRYTLAAAENGSAKAKLNLGRFYRNGWGTPVDAQKAEEWLRSAADDGEAEAALMLADWYREGDFIPQDYAKAFGLYQSGAEAGNADCAYELGRAYLLGEGTKVNNAAGKAWLECAAENGSAKAIRDLSILYDKGSNGFPSDQERAFRWMLKHCQIEDDAVGSFLLALRYHNGEGTSEDPEAAFLWMNRAAELGYPNAFTQLVEYFAKGYGTPYDPGMATKCLERAKSLGAPHTDNLETLLPFYLAQGKADANPNDLEQQYKFATEHISIITEKAVSMLEACAEKGHAPSCVFLRSLYRYGNIVPADPQKANYWLEKSAACFDELAVLDLVTNYDSGSNGYPKDPRMSFYWLNRMLEHDPGNATMQELVGLSYLNGEGVARDSERGIALVCQAAYANNAHAQSLLGGWYHNGFWNIDQNLYQAEYWLELAVSNGNEQSRQELERVRQEQREGGQSQSDTRVDDTKEPKLVLPLIIGILSVFLATYIPVVGIIVAIANFVLLRVFKKRGGYQGALFTITLVLNVIALFIGAVKLLI